MHFACTLQVCLALWPNKDFGDKRTKFGIDVLSLEALLDYSEKDVKECHFEVSMFAEMFKEMLQTRFARGLMRGLAVIEQEVGTDKLYPMHDGSASLVASSARQLSQLGCLVRTRQVADILNVVRGPPQGCT